MRSVEIHRAVNAADVANQAAQEVYAALVNLQKTKSKINIVLTGGTVGILTLKHFGELADLSVIDFTKVHFWFGDERFVESDSPDRNANQAKQAMLDLLPIPKENIHEFPASDSGMDLAECADLFEKEAESLSRNIDLMLLGMGPDGHVASLFPGHIYPNRLIVAEANSPKPPSQRLSMSYELINSSDRIIFVVSGIDKAEAIQSVHKDAECELPAAKITAVGQTLWIIDEAAGSAFWSC